MCSSNLKFMDEHLSRIQVDRSLLNSGEVLIHKLEIECHTHHASVTDFRPIWGNTVEVAHMTSSVMYINSHKLPFP